MKRFQGQKQFAEELVLPYGSRGIRVHHGKGAMAAGSRQQTADRRHRGMSLKLRAYNLNHKNRQRESEL